MYVFEAFVWKSASLTALLSPSIRSCLELCNLRLFRRCRDAHAASRRSELLGAVWTCCPYVSDCEVASLLMAASCSKFKKSGKNFSMVHCEKRGKWALRIKLFRLALPTSIVPYSPPRTSLREHQTRGQIFPCACEMPNTQ